MLFNCNHKVKVKLTDYGREILRGQNILLNKGLPKNVTLNLSIPNEDAKGWSEWQLWVLMERFGCYLKPGGEEPFEMDIEIPVDGG